MFSVQFFIAMVVAIEQLQVRMIITSKFQCSLGCIFTEIHVNSIMQ